LLSYFSRNTFLKWRESSRWPIANHHSIIITHIKISPNCTIFHWDHWVPSQKALKNKRMKEEKEGRVLSEKIWKNTKAKIENNQKQKMQVFLNSSTSFSHFCWAYLSLWRYINQNVVSIFQIDRLISCLALVLLILIRKIFLTFLFFVVVKIKNNQQNNSNTYLISINILS